MPQRNTAYRWTVAVAMVVALTGCSADDSDRDEIPNIEQTVTPEQSPDITDITDDYFGDASYVGMTVTVTGEVTRVFTPTAFVLTGEEWDDDSLLVLSTAPVNVRQWQMATVTGTVQRLDYTGFDAPGSADDEDLAAEFAGEELLVTTAKVKSGSPVPSHPPT